MRFVVNSPSLSHCISHACANNREERTARRFLTCRKSRYPGKPCLPELQRSSAPVESVRNASATPVVPPIPFRRRHKEVPYSATAQPGMFLSKGSISNTPIGHSTQWCRAGKFLPATARASWGRYRAPSGRPVWAGPRRFRAGLALPQTLRHKYPRSRKGHVAALRLLQRLQRHSSLWLPAGLPISCPWLSGRCKPCAADDERVHLPRSSELRRSCRSPCAARMAIKLGRTMHVFPDTQLFLHEQAGADFAMNLVMPR